MELETNVEIEISILNSLGFEVSKRKYKGNKINESVNLSELPTIIYFVKVDGVDHLKKFVKLK